MRNLSSPTRFHFLSSILIRILMNLRFIYMIVFGLLGVVLGALAATFGFAMSAGFFWTFVFGDNPWPAWTSVVMLLVFLLIFLFIVGLAGFKGFQYGYSLEKKENKTALYKKAFFHLFLSVIVLIVFGVYSAYKSRQNNPVIALGGLANQAYMEKMNHLKDIREVSISQIEKGMDVVVDIDGQTDDKYSLSIELIGQGYARESILKESQDIELKFYKQSFHFEFPFDDLAQAYRKVLENYVLNFNKKFAIDEVIEVKASLTLNQALPSEEEIIKKYGPPAKTYSVILQLNFSCEREKCEVVQKEKPADTSSSVTQN